MHRHYPEQHRKVRQRGRHEERKRKPVDRQIPEKGGPAKALKTELVFSAVEERKVYSSIQPQFLSRGLKRKFKHLLEGEKNE